MSSFEKLFVDLPRNGVIESLLVKITSYSVLRVAIETDNNFDGKLHMPNTQYAQNEYGWMPKPQSAGGRQAVFCPPVVVSAQAALDPRFDAQVIATGDYGYRVRGKTGS